MRANRTDGNKSEIVAALRKAGAEWVSCEGDPKIGFDGLVAFRSVLYAVEIKNGSLPPSRRRLTKGESDRAEQLARKGVKLLIILDPQDALRQIGAMK
jgi:hypothetical protein